MNTELVLPVTTLPDGCGVAQFADALVALGRPIRTPRPAPSQRVPGKPILGRALPVQHFGSVDVFLEALERSVPGQILTADNAGRLDEGCIGDLVALEAKTAGLAGIVIFGANRDTAQLLQLQLPVWSLGVCPVGPTRLDAPCSDYLATARLGTECVTVSDWIVADSDGVLIISDRDLVEVQARAFEISTREMAQAGRVAAGASLREQFHFREFLKQRAKHPSLTFREHLKSLAAAIET